MESDLAIIYEDKAVIVVNKPAGITVNRSETTKGEKTVQDWAEGYLKVPRVPQVPRVSREDSTHSTFIERAGIVHRLDKETSGILLIAKTQVAFADLQRQFKERIVKKTYIALAHGVILPKDGEIRIPVGRLPWNRKRFGVVAGGRDAVTRYKTISNFIHSTGSGQISNRQENLTLLELFPETGRTHQIRVHMKYLNHPIFGDNLYAGRKTARNDRKLLPRVFLHASSITFYHPQTHKEVSFESPLPIELEQFLHKLT